MLITHVPTNLTDLCIEQLFLIKKFLGSDPLNITPQTSLSNNTWCSGNLINLFNKNINLFCNSFLKSTDFFKNQAEKLYHTRLNYQYIHFIDYCEGGSMDFHSHEHTEDFVYILYLNDCYDGETNFYLKDVVSLTPKKSQIVFFESHIEHSGSFSEKKQILVGGLKKFS